MQKTELGKTGIRVSPLSFGAMHIGSSKLSLKEAETLLHEVLDSEINLIDTARAYEESEERIGRLLYSQRERFYLSTKVGYMVDGAEDWTSAAITLGVEHADQLMSHYLSIGADWPGVI